jgi:hypothetical protein
VTWIEALDVLAADPHIEQYLVLTSDTDPNYKGWRRHVVALAGGNPAPERKQSYPPASQAQQEKPPRRKGGCCGGVPMPG